MKRTLFILLSITMAYGCKTPEKKVEPPKPKIEKKVVKKRPPVKTGWLDPNTYTIFISGNSSDDAVKKAKLKFFKDIVKARTLSGSPYTNIAQISDEFDKPLKNAKIIRKEKIDSGVAIYFQVRYPNLRRMFKKGR